MKSLLVAGTACLGLLASAALAAPPVVFTYTGSLVTFVVPATGPYQILAFGAQGGDLTVLNVGSTIGPGGLGAEIGGDFSLSAGELLQIAVGGAGSRGTGGGGGGSFVVGPDNTPLVIAGGGGGGGIGGVERNEPLLGGGGLTGPNGGFGSEGGVGGNGGGGGGTGTGAGGGGGFLSAGGNAVGGTGGGAFPGLAGGDIGGGFGGGGGPAGGGGGGYSGGGGGRDSPGAFNPGGGGGSFDAGSNQILVANFWSGFGQVVISAVFAGTPGKATCHDQTVAALALQYGAIGDAAAALGYSSVGALQKAISVYCAGDATHQ
jgi:hypothetical protein